MPVEFAFLAKIHRKRENRNFLQGGNFARAFCEWPPCQNVNKHIKRSLLS